MCGFTDPIHELPQSRPFALGDHLDSPISEISYPTGNFKLFGNSPSVVPKSNALYLAREKQIPTFMHGQICGRRRDW